MQTETHTRGSAGAPPLARGRRGSGGAAPTLRGRPFPRGGFLATFSFWPDGEPSIGGGPRASQPRPERPSRLKPSNDTKLRSPARSSLHTRHGRQAPPLSRRARRLTSESKTAADRDPRARARVTRRRFVFVGVRARFVAFEAASVGFGAPRTPVFRCADGSRVRPRAADVARLLRVCSTSIGRARRSAPNGRGSRRRPTRFCLRSAFAKRVFTICRASIFRHFLAPRWTRFSASNPAALSSAQVGANGRPSSWRRSPAAARVRARRRYVYGASPPERRCATRSNAP